MRADVATASRVLTQHGCLVVVRGVGLLLCGESGVGKSALALELLRRGHPLVADDVVRVEARDGWPWGAAPEATAGRLEVREVGVVQVAVHFGVAAVAEESRIDVIVELQRRVTPPPRPVATPVSAPLCGIDLPRYSLAAGDTAHLANRVEVIARLVSNGGEGARHG